MNATYKIILRKSYKNSDGKHPLYLRLTINRKSKYYSLGVFVDENELKEGKHTRVRENVIDSYLINLKLSDAEEKTQSILNNFQRYKTPATFTDFEFQYIDGCSKESFDDYANTYIKTNPILVKESR